MRILYLTTWEPKKTNSPTPGAFPHEELVAHQHFLLSPFFPQENLFIDVIGPGTKCLPGVLGTLWQGLRAWHHAREFDLVIGIGFKPTVGLLVLRWLSRSTYPPLILYDFKAFGHAQHNPGIVWMVTKLLSSVTGILYAGRSTERYYFSMFPRLKNKFKYYTIGTDSEQFFPFPNRVTKPEILVFGHDSRDYETLFAAWKEIAPHFPEIRLRIVGAKPAFPLPTQTVLENEMSQAELNKRIQQSLFVVFPLPEHEWLAGILSILNTLAQGVATIVSDASYTREYLIDDTAYLRIPVGDQKNLADAMRLLLANTELRTKIAHRARSYVTTHFTKEASGRSQVASIFTFIEDQKRNTTHPSIPPTTD